MGFHWPEVFLLLITVFWLAAIIHCIMNRWLKAGEKVAWILFFLFASWIGALSYFIYWYGFAKQKRSQILSPVRLRDISSPRFDVSSVPSYSPYERGYQPIRTPPSSQEEPFTFESGEQEEKLSPLYEQPQVMYPEDPR